MLSTAVGRFRLVAVLEAASWAGLLLGMLLKYVVADTDVLVQVFGPIHGVIFLAYLGATAAAWGTQGWPTRVGLLGLAAGVPPFGTIVFERWAHRRGLLEPVAEDALA